MSGTAELSWTDSGTGRDVDDKVSRLKWFCSEAQLRDSDIKAHAASFSLHVLHAHPSLSHPFERQQNSACGGQSIRFQNFRLLCFTVCATVESSSKAHPSHEVRNYVHANTLTTSIWYPLNKESGLICCLLGSSNCYSEVDIRRQVLSMWSPFPEPHSTKSASPLEWGGLSREIPRCSPNTFSWSSIMSFRMSAIISKRKSKEPGGP